MYHTHYVYHCRSTLERALPMPVMYTHKSCCLCQSSTVSLSVQHFVFGDHVPCVWFVPHLTLSMPPPPPRRKWTYMYVCTCLCTSLPMQQIHNHTTSNPQQYLLIGCYSVISLTHCRWAACHPVVCSNGLL